jgi:hypothetical protein
MSNCHASCELADPGGAFERPKTATKALLELTASKLEAKYENTGA